MGCQLYLSPHSSSAMRARMPLDVPAAYRSIMDSSLEVAMLDEARAEDDDADHDRGDGSEQHRAGGDVLGLAGERMEAGRDEVGQALERGVHALGRPDQGER